MSQTNLLEGLTIGDVEDGGWGITNGASCAYPNADGFIPLAEVEYLYLGSPGTITPVAHPEWGAEFADCGEWNDLFDWSLPEWSGEPGGVAGVCIAPPYGCGEVPVDDALCSWGRIKTLFR